MKHTLTELVDVILRKIQESPDALPTESGIRSWLVRQGYNKRDIDAAIKLVRPRFVQKDRGDERARGSIRALSEYEQHKLTPEARAALGRLESYQLVEPYEREMILDRLDHFEGEVGLPELEYLISWLVCSNRDYESQRTIYSMLDGQKNTLH